VRRLWARYLRWKARRMMKRGEALAAKAKVLLDRADELERQL
jgi:hypothetical protein